MRTPLTLVTGSLGSGKTTLLRHILTNTDRKIAIIMNEFGEIGIDSKIVKGKNVEIAALDGGCVCCSLLGEFEAAVNEIIETVQPDLILLETTGVAEPDAIIFDIQESLTQVRLDGVITVIDADSMLRFPELGRTLRIQIEDSDLMILNKEDIVSEEALTQIENTLKTLNPTSPIIRTQSSRVDTDLLFGLDRNKQLSAPNHRHQNDYQTIYYQGNKMLDPKKFTLFVNNLSPSIIRAKGFIQFPGGTSLFNYVAGRWDLEPFEEETTTLVFIGKELNTEQILSQLKSCEI